MLAQNFKTAHELGIRDEQLDALQKVLVLLETGKLTHTPADHSNYKIYPEAPFTGHFNMAAWRQETDCGTVCCIGGTAEAISGIRFNDDYDENEELCDLFHPPHFREGKITTAQAAIALRSYLTTGEAHWALAVARSPQESGS